MNEILYSFIDKNVIVTIIDGNCLVGRLDKVSDGWMSVANRINGQTQAVNISLVTKIEDYPVKNKK